MAIIFRALCGYLGLTKAEVLFVTGATEILRDRKDLREFRAEFQARRPDVVLDMCLFTEMKAYDLMATVDGIAPRVVALSSADSNQIIAWLHDMDSLRQAIRNVA